jgi:Flp pilus assembly protein TadD
MHIATPAPLSDVTNWYQDARKARSAGDVRGTLTILDRILAHDPKHVGALYLRGVIAFESNQLEAAQDSIQRAIDIEPDANSFNLLHIIQVRSGNSERAIQTALQGLALHPHSTALLQSMAFTLRRMGRWEEAAIHSRQLLELQPNDATAHNDLGLTLEAMGEFDDQVRHIRTAVSLAPNHLEFRANLAHALLAAGRYKEAWPYYEDRWANGMLPDGSRDSSRPQIPLPQWKGEQPVTAFARKNKGRRQGRLLVTYEQGFGDSLQFVRYLPLALEHFSKITYACPPHLWRLYEESLCSRWPGIELIAAIPSDLNGWDWYCPLMSLPLAFNTRLETIPANLPYLYADPKLAVQWREKLAALPNSEQPRVGIVWAGGNANLQTDPFRSLKPSQIAPLLALPNIHWVSLQKAEVASKQADTATRQRLTDWMDEVKDFADTAALIENLDLVISVDTSTAHLAAAMGKSVWLLNRFAGCWRWLRNRDDSPWYPTVRIFNQTQRGNWDDVLARVATALQQQWLPSHKPRSR